LGKFYKEGQQNLILRQALRRIEALEKLTGLEVSRVMAPPHGACSEIFLSEMARLGFESACISGGSLRRYNGKASWIKTYGMRPSDIIRGLPVFPRFPISRECHNSILLAALLHQPIIPMGHHLDVANGLQMLDELAAFVNSFGTVRWVDMKRICRSHYARRFDGSTMSIRMYTKRIDVLVPDDVNRIRVDRSQAETEMSDQIVWRTFGDDANWWHLGLDQSIPVSKNRRIEISYVTTIPSFVDAKTLRKPDIWPILRRQLTEARDRMLPSFRRVSSFLNRQIPFGQ
jgi:hypothetical protein